MLTHRFKMNVACVPMWIHRFYPFIKNGKVLLK